MRIAVIGCGFVGLVTAVGLALKNHKVIGIDIDKARIKQISQGIVPFHEPDVSKVLKDLLQREDLQVSNFIEDAAKSEIVLICVQTPSQLNGAIDLRAILTATNDLASLFVRNPLDRTVVIRSTVVPGTTDKLVTPIFQKVSRFGQTEVAFNPEFLREGFALADFLNPDRIVIGTHSAEAARILRKLYTSFKAPIIITTPATAELAKYTSNTLLATLISFSNEIARICELVPGADVEDVLDIVRQDWRFVSSTDGEKPNILTYLKAGCGFGGSCLPKDLSALISHARSLGQETPLLEAVATVNKTQPGRVVKITSDALKGLMGRRVAVLGVAFKEGTDDLRESSGLKIVNELLKQKAKVIIYDPLVEAAALKEYTKGGVIIVYTLRAALREADACIVASNAPEFRMLNHLKKRLRFKHPTVIDGRRIVKKPRNSEDEYFAVGKAKRGIDIS